MKYLAALCFTLSLLSSQAMADGYNNFDCWNGGQNAFPSITTGNLNVSCGHGNFSKLTTGNFNISFGSGNGASVTTQSSLTIIGRNIDVAAGVTANWLNVNNAIVGSTTAMAASSCGTGAVVSGTSLIGSVVTGTGATACTLTFPVAKVSAPSCVVSARSGTPPVYTTSTAALTLSTAAASATYDYFCSGI